MASERRKLMPSQKTIDESLDQFKMKKYYPEEYFRRSGYAFKPLLDERRADSVSNYKSSSRSLAKQAV